MLISIIPCIPSPELTFYLKTFKRLSIFSGTNMAYRIHNIWGLVTSLTLSIATSTQGILIFLQFFKYILVFQTYISYK